MSDSSPSRRPRGLYRSRQSRPAEDITYVEDANGNTLVAADMSRRETSCSGDDLMLTGLKSQISAQ